jgi:hypothetical protein
MLFNILELFGLDVPAKIEAGKPATRLLALPFIRQGVSLRRRE